MIYALNRIIDLITIKQYEYAYAIADSVHAFPTILLEEDGRSMKQYWKQDIPPRSERNGIGLCIMRFGCVLKATNPVHSPLC